MKEDIENIHLKPYDLISQSNEYLIYRRNMTESKAFQIGAVIGLTTIIISEKFISPYYFKAKLSRAVFTLHLSLSFFLFTYTITQNTSDKALASKYDSKIIY